jgi:5-methylthioribose kinase
MVTPDSTMLIDPEFAYVGPMAFDVGKFVGNLLLALFASDGHNGDGSRSTQQVWISSSIAEFWNTFSKRCAASRGEEGAAPAAAAAAAAAASAAAAAATAAVPYAAVACWRWLVVLVPGSRSASSQQA